MFLYSGVRLRVRFVCIGNFICVMNEQALITRASEEYETNKSSSYRQIIIFLSLSLSHRYMPCRQGPKHLQTASPENCKTTSKKEGHLLGKKVKVNKAYTNFKYLPIPEPSNLQIQIKNFTDFVSTLKKTRQGLYRKKGFKKKSKHYPPPPIMVVICKCSMSFLIQNNSYFHACTTNIRIKIGYSIHFFNKIRYESFEASLEINFD